MKSGRQALKWEIFAKMAFNHTFVETPLRQTSIQVKYLVLTMMRQLLLTDSYVYSEKQMR